MSRKPPSYAGQKQIGQKQPKKPSATSAPPSAVPLRLAGLQALAALKPHLAKSSARAASAPEQAPPQPPTVPADNTDFIAAMQGVTPLDAKQRALLQAALPPAQARQRERDEAAVLLESLSDEIDVESLLETDEALSYRRSGVGPDVLRKLRRGTWVVQGEVDLHGHRVDEARAAVADLLREAVKRGLRCVRIVHGKGLGSKDRTPVLKGKVRGWLVQRDEVIAFCQARPAEGGSGALIVLLRPTQPKPAAQRL